MDIANIDLKFDIGKGGDEENITVTGSYKVGGEDGAEIELAESVRGKGLEEQQDTRILIEMKKDDGDWCVEKFTDLADEVEGEALEEEAE